MSNGAWAIRPPIPRHDFADRAGLEGQPHARGSVVAVILISLRDHTVQKFPRFQRPTCRQVVAGEVERRVRSEAPGDPAVDLRTDVAVITLDKPFVSYGHPGRAAEGAIRDVERLRTAGIRVHLFRCPGRRSHAVHAQGRRDAVRCPEGELSAAVAIVADVGVHALVGAATAVEIVDAEAENPEPATAEVAGVQVERLVVALALGQVVPSLVPGRVHWAALEEQRTQLEATDDVEEPS